MTSICTAPIYELKELNCLFIELTAKNCNQRCSSCYIKFPIGKAPKDYISIDKIKTALIDTQNENVRCICLTGGEPMLHPDFNSILRLCLKYSNVCIFTNGSFLNEKKIRFLYKVESEGNHQILFRLSLTHFNELENDKHKYRGNFRQTIFALKTISHYNFNSILSIQNINNISQNQLSENFKNLFAENNINNCDLQVNCSFPDYSDENFVTPAAETDCMMGRVLTESGIYSCPFLASDYRGRCGSDFKNYSKSILAETEFCASCSKNNKSMFTIC